MFNQNVSDIKQLKIEVSALADAFEERKMSRSEVLLCIGDFFWKSCMGYCAYAAYQLAKEAGGLDGPAEQRMAALGQSPFLGKMCVITGELNEMERKQALMEVEKRGGKTSDKAVNTMDILILGNQEWSEWNGGVASRKVQKAADLKKRGKDIQIISENEFYSMLFAFKA